MDDKEVMPTFINACLIDLRNANSRKLLNQLVDLSYNCSKSLGFMDLGQALGLLLGISKLYFLPFTYNRTHLCEREEFTFEIPNKFLKL